MPGLSLSKTFRARFDALTEGRQAWIAGRLALFVERPDDPILRLRPFQCAPGHWLIDSVRYDRIVLRAEADGVYVAVDCGGHELIDLWEQRAAGAAASKHEA